MNKYLIILMIICTLGFVLGVRDGMRQRRLAKLPPALSDVAVMDFLKDMAVKAGYTGCVTWGEIKEIGFDNTANSINVYVGFKAGSMKVGSNDPNEMREYLESLKQDKRKKPNILIGYSSSKVNTTGSASGPLGRQTKPIDPPCAECFGRRWIGGTRLSDNSVKGGRPCLKCRSPQ